MKYILALYLFFVSCNEEKKRSPIDQMEYDRQVAHIKDSMMNKIMSEINWDTVGLSSSPIVVTKAVLYKEEYSNYRDISLTFKNVSNKKIDAIRFSWYGENSFGEPADMGGYGDRGFGGGFIDRPLGPGKTTSASWSIMSRDGKKVIKAWPIEVAFSDGTKWKTTSR